MDNIRVAARVRPPNKENVESTPWVISSTEIKHVVNSKVIGSPYNLDRVFSPVESTECVFNEVCRPIVDAAMKGINGTIFAYGQTASGKTYTMLGTREDPGVIRRVVDGIFIAIENTPEREFLLRVSYMEIYNEVVVDLLQKDPKRNKRQSLKIFQDAEGNTNVSALTEWTVTSPDTVMKCIAQGERQRTTAETNMNDVSSRSHSIFRVVIESRLSSENDCGGQEYGAVAVSQLNLVDLAGSERSGQMGEIGDRLKEGCAINKSLSVLGQVISNLSEGSDGQNGQFVNFRDSKLTRILQPALGGNSMTVVICTVTLAFIQETHSTLRFATRAKKIKNKPIVNEVVSGSTELQRFAKEITMLKQKLSEMQNMEKALAEKNDLNRLLEKQVKEMNEKLIVSSLRGGIRSPCLTSAQKGIRRLTWCGEVVNIKRRRLQPLPSTSEECILESPEDIFKGAEKVCLEGENFDMSIPETMHDKCDVATNTDNDLKEMVREHESCQSKINTLVVDNDNLKEDREACLKEYRQLQEFTKLEKDMKVFENSRNAEYEENLRIQKDLLAKAAQDNTDLRNEVLALRKQAAVFENLKCDLEYQLERQAGNFKAREADLRAQLKDTYDKMNNAGNLIVFNSDITVPGHALSVQLTAAEARIRTLEAELLSRKAECNSKIEKLVEKCASLSAVLKFDAEFNQGGIEILKSKRESLEERSVQFLLNDELTENIQDIPDITMFDTSSCHEKSDFRETKKTTDTECQTEFTEVRDGVEAAGKNLVDEVLLLRGNCKDLNLKNKDLAETLGNFEGKCWELELELPSVRESLRIKEMELSSLLEKAEIAEQELKELRPKLGQIDVLQSDLETVRKGYEEQFHEVTRVTAIWQNLQVDCDLLRAENETLLKHLHEALTSNEELAGNIRDKQSLTERLSAEQADILEKAQKISELTEHCEKLRNRIDEMESGQLVHLESLREQFGEFVNSKLTEQELQLQKEKLAEIENLKKEMRDKLGEEMNCTYREKLAEICNEKAKMEENVAKLEKTIKNLESELRDKDGELRSTDVLPDECRDCRQLQNVLSGKMAEIERQRSEASECEERVKLEVRDLREQRDELEMALSKMKTDLEERELIWEDCRGKLADAEFKSLTQIRSEETREVQLKLSSREHAITELQSDLEVVRSSLVDVTVACKAEINDLKDSYEKKIAVLDKINEDVKEELAVQISSFEKVKLERDEAKEFSNSQIALLEKAKTDLQKELTLSTKTVDLLKLDVDLLKSSLEKEKCRFETTTKERDHSHKAEILNLVNLKKDLEGNLELKEEGIAKLEKDICEMQRDFNEEKKSLELVCAQKFYDETSALKISHKSELRQLEKLKEDLVQKLEASIAAHLQEIFNLKSQLEKRDECSECVRLKNGEKSTTVVLDASEIARLKEDAQNQVLELEHWKQLNADLQEELEDTKAELERVGKFCDDQTKDFETFTFENLEAHERLHTLERIIAAVKEANGIDGIKSTLDLRGVPVPIFSKEAVEKLIFPLKHYEDTVNRLKLQCKDLLSKNEVDCKFYTNLQMKCSELSSRVESFTTACDEKQLKITALEDEMKKCKPLQCECKLQPIPHFKKRIAQLEQCEERYKSQIRRLQAHIAEPTVPLRRPSEDKSLTATSTTYECSSYGSGTVNSVILMEMKEKEAHLEAKMKKLAKNNDQLKAKLQQYMERMENMKRVVESTPASISSVKSCLQLGPLSYEATSSMDNTARYFESTLRTPAVKKERDITDFEVLENSPPKRSRLPETVVSNLNETTKVTLSPSSREMYERCDVQ